MFKLILKAILIILLLLEIRHLNHALFMINKTLDRINSNVEESQGTWEDNQNFDT